MRPSGVCLAACRIVIHSVITVCREELEIVFFAFRFFCSFFDVEGKCWRGRGFEFWEFQKKKNLVGFFSCGGRFGDY